MGKDGVKQSFIVYYDWEEDIEDFTDEQAGALLRAMFAYQKRGEVYSGDDSAVRAVFRFIRRTFDRDREKYKERCRQNQENGKKGGRPTKNKKPNGFSENPEKPNGFFENRTKAKKPDNDNEHEHEPDTEPDTEHEHEPEHEPDRDADSGALAAAAAAEKKALDDFFALLRAETSIVPDAKARETLLGWYRSYGSETVEWLIREAAANNARKFGYLEAIMRRWERDGLTDAASQRRAPSRSKKATGPEPCVTPRRVSDAELKENRRQLEKLLADTAWMDKTGEKEEKGKGDKQGRKQDAEKAQKTEKEKTS
ncbi:MAG: DnaD domain protein [Clostridiales bacterium]|nr:DnaD domain protein [Clostridiales bacterium]